MRVLVTGAKGQLGSDLLCELSKRNIEAVGIDIEDLDITDAAATKKLIEGINNKTKLDAIIHCAAYTAVDAAEDNEALVTKINAEGTKNIAEVAKTLDVAMMYISTDYVFDGETDLPYTEDDFTNPLGVYGASKLEGENLALEKNPKTIIIRTSWLYSEFNKNFVKTMLNLFSTKDELNVVADQFGQPTNANDLAKVIMKIIRTEEKEYGIFHFSNYPETTWFDFAQKIAELSESKIKINPITTDQYPTPAKRPMRSTMCLDKIENSYNIEPR